MTKLTARGYMETIVHEAIVQEAYKDSEGIWTWGVGLTKPSGVDPLLYKDKPAPISKCLSEFIRIADSKYIPEVLRAFGTMSLNEAQLAAAFAFHWNTGAIGKTSWVSMVRAGKLADARDFLETHYLNGGALANRRKKEAALFFSGVWSKDTKAMVYPVSKPSYQPSWKGGRKVDISQDLATAMAQK